MSCNKFCKKCGAEMQLGERIFGYDECTGTPIRDAHCSKDPCHTNHDFRWLEGEEKKQYNKTKRLSWWRRQFISSVDAVCTRCGKEYLGLTIPTGRKGI